MKNKKNLISIIILLILIFSGGIVFGFKLDKKNNKVITKLVEEESTTVDVVDRSSKSVVTVSIEQDVGTGFIISSDGLIVTNKHVVSDLVAKYKVIIGEETFEVKNIYRDPINDLAILKIDQNNLIPVDLGDSDQLKVGQTVIAIGTALGEFRSTVTKGVISGLGRGITAGGVGVASEKLEGVIQTDAAINSGNSGGPLFNIIGQVIGVNVAVSQNGQNIGFALPINLVKNSVDNFRKTGEFDRPYLGVVYKTISDDAAKKNNVSVGDYIQSVAENSPAEKSGIKSGDIVIEIDGQKITGDDKVSIAKTISQKKIGDEVRMKLLRDKNNMEIMVKLEKKL